MTTNKVRSIGPLGVEVEIDLRAELTSDAQEHLRCLFARHKLLLFRNQSLTMEQQRRVVACLGPLADQDPLYDTVSLDDGWLNRGPLVFHSDMAWVAYPPESISLFAADVEDDATYTSFVDAAAAYRRLPASLAEEVAKLSVVAVTLGAADSDDYPPFDASGEFTRQRKLVLTHPGTLEPILYIGRGAVSRIVGMDEVEGRSVFEELFAYIYDSDFVLRHQWRNGDLIIWDNLALQHGRPDLSNLSRRTLRRVTIASHDLSSQLPASFTNPALISAKKGNA